MLTGSFTIALPLLLVSLPAAKADVRSLDQGYRQMYNLQFDEAHRSFKLWKQVHPADPMGPGSDAAVYLFSEFDRLHILQSDLFEDDRRFVARRAPADPELKQRFNIELESIVNLSSSDRGCSGRRLTYGFIRHTLPDAK